jgi:hypothetical protein
LSSTVGSESLLNATTLNYAFTDFSASLKEGYHKDLKGKRKFSMDFFNIAFDLNFILKAIKETERPYDDAKTEIEKFEISNMEQVLMTEISHHRLCRRNLLGDRSRNFTGERHCDCSYECLFHIKCTCCVDTAMTHPVECIKPVKFHLQSTAVPPYGILVVSRCYNGNPNLNYTIKYNKIVQLCEEGANEYDIPVLSRNIPYKNVFCFLCNTDFTTKNESLVYNSYKVVDFRLVCDTQFSFVYSMNLRQLVHQIKSEKCYILYNVDGLVTCKHATTISKCPEFGQNHSSQEYAVKWLCEKSSNNLFTSVDGYKNEFCHVCNLKDTGVAKKCHQSKTCLSLRNVRKQLANPYRNALCSNCHEHNTLEKYASPIAKDCKPILGTGFHSLKDLVRDLFFSINIGGHLFEKQIQVKTKINRFVSSIVFQMHFTMQSLLDL